MNNAVPYPFADSTVHASLSADRKSCPIRLFSRAAELSIQCRHFLGGPSAVCMSCPKTLCNDYPAGDPFLHVTYLAHDLDDPSIWRRVRMLRQGGAQVRVAGFRRGQGALPEPATVLGRTSNGRMIQRVRAIAEDRKSVV